jgi:transcriptional regulator GlxA family with amidase domain
MPSRPAAPPELPPPASAAILAVPEVTASVLYGLSDLLHSAGRDWGLIVEGRPGAPVVAPRIVSARQEPFTIANGVTIVADATLEEAERPDLVCIPELLIAPGDCLAGRYEREIAWLRRPAAGRGRAARRRGGHHPLGLLRRARRALSPRPGAAAAGAGGGQGGPAADHGRRRFQLATSLTPIQYVQTVRIEEAKQLLETGGRIIEAIAAELGYEDPRFFVRLFKREMKHTPSQYRRKFGHLRAVLQTARRD